MSAEIVRAHPSRELPANFDKRIAAAYLEIESLVRDVDRMAHIARSLAMCAIRSTSRTNDSISK